MDMEEYAEYNIAKCMGNADVMIMERYVDSKIALTSIMILNTNIVLTANIIIMNIYIFILIQHDINAVMNVITTIPNDEVEYIDNKGYRSCDVIPNLTIIIPS